MTPVSFVSPPPEKFLFSIHCNMCDELIFDFQIGRQDIGINKQFTEAWIICNICQSKFRNVIENLMDMKMTKSKKNDKNE